MGGELEFGTEGRQNTKVGAIELPWVGEDVKSRKEGHQTMLNNAMQEGHVMWAAVGGRVAMANNAHVQTSIYRVSAGTQEEKWIRDF